MNKVRILVADDHEVVRRGVRMLLEAQPGWEVIGEAATGREAAKLAKKLKPHVVVLDITMPELNGLEAIRHISKAVPQTEVLVLTVHESEQMAREVLAAGARGYILKSDASRDLAAAVEALSEHKPFFTSRVSQFVLEGYLEGSGEGRVSLGQPSPLTPREREVLQLLAEGKSTKEASAALSISVKTAETHRNNLMRKLNLHSVSDLVHFAIRNGIVVP